MAPIRRTDPPRCALALSARSTGDRRAFSLLESVIATLLVGVLLVASLRTLGATVRSRQAHVGLSAADALCRHLVTEVMQASYQDPGNNPVFGPESGEVTGNRSAFNDVDDYHGWTETPPRRKDGTSLSEFAGWTRGVSVAFVDPQNLQNVGVDQNLKRITVTVTDPQGQITTYVALRGKHGPGEASPSVSTTYVTWAGISLRSGSAAAPITSGTRLVNQPTAN